MPSPSPPSTPRPAKSSRSSIYPVSGFSGRGGWADNKGVSPSDSDNRGVDRRSVIKAAAAAAGLLAAGGATAWAAVSAGGPGGEGVGAGGATSPTDGQAGSAGSRADRGTSGEGGDRSRGGNNGSSDKEGKRPDGPGDSRPAEGEPDRGAQTTQEAEEPSTANDHGGKGDGKPTDADKDPGGDKPGNHGDGDGNGDGNGHGDGDGGDPGVPALLQASAVPVGGGVVVPQHRIVVTQPQAGTFRCFGSRCPHAGCMVDAVTDGTIHCPCHGSLFDMTSGEPVAGPAPRALDSVAIKVKSGRIYRA